MLYQLSYASAAQTEGGYQTGNTIASAVRPGASKSEANPSTSDVLYTFVARMCQVNFTRSLAFHSPLQIPVPTEHFSNAPEPPQWKSPAKR
jgi:hypothetical protein